MSRLARDVARALVECVRSPSAPAELACLAGDAGLGALADAAAAHGVSGFVWRAVRAAGLGDRPDAAPLRSAVAVAAGRHLRAMAEVERIDAALRDVPWLLFKGPVLATLVHGSPTLRSPVDLDVLVPRSAFRCAVRGLERAGCTVYERNWTLVRTARLGSLRLHTPSGALIDLHWDLLNDAAARGAFRVSSAAAIDRARVVPLGSVRVRTLDPVDTVVHLALHAALAGAHRLVWLADVAAATSGLTADERSATLPARAAEWAVEPAVALVLRRSAAVLGPAAFAPAAPGSAAAPAPVSGRARDGVSADGFPVGLGWRAVCAAVDAMAPVSRWSGGPTVAAAVARSARADGPASLRELRRHALAALRSGPARLDPQALFDPTDPASVAYPCGGVDERGAYLSEVSGAPA